MVKYALPIIVLLGAIVIATLLLTNRPEPRSRPATVAPLVVDVVPLQRQNYQPIIETFGTIKAPTRGDLVTQVAGQVTSVSEQFVEGGFFDKGDELLIIDRRDYEVALTVARGELAEARQRLALEEAQAQQAEQQWRKLHPNREPNALLARKPQLAAAGAAVTAAKARLQKAELDLQRTRITAPYDGRVIGKYVDVGQYVSVNTPLAEIFATEKLEVRMPLNSTQISYIDLPEQYRADSERAEAIPVTIRAKQGNREFTWQARLDRTESAVDPGSRQVYVVAQIDNPYEKDTGKPTLKIGQFITAQIAGKPLEDVYVVPAATVRQDDQIMVAIDGKLQAVNVEVLWRGEEQLVINTDLNVGTELVTSPVSASAFGSPVKVRQQDVATPEPELEVVKPNSPTGSVVGQGTLGNSLR